MRNLLGLLVLTSFFVESRAGEDTRILRDTSVALQSRSSLQSPVHKFLNSLLSKTLMHIKTVLQERCCVVYSTTNPKYKCCRSSDILQNAFKLEG